MPEFQLDLGTQQSAAAFGQLDAFTRGYIEAAFFTETNELYASDEWDSPKAQEDIAEGRCSGNIPSDSSVADLAPDALAAAIADCSAFQEGASKLLWAASELRGYTDEQAGRDFWLTRNGHGAGFWGRDELENFGAEIGPSLGDRLSGHARSFGAVDMYRGDDSQIYFS